MEDSDCCVFMGSNMAENHPVAFRWPMKAKVEHGAKLIHVDPRFTRTSAMCDIYAPIRAGSDIAFLGALINYVINSERWNKEPFFRTFVTNYTNAPVLINEQFQDTEDLDGVFSGLMQYQENIAEWPLNGFVGQYENKTWQYAQTSVQPQGWQAATAKSGEQPVGKEQQSGRGAAGPAQVKDGEARKAGAKGPPYDALVQSLLQPPPTVDQTLENPRCVFQLIKRHFSRYTPEMVEKVTGCPKETFLKVAETILANSGPDRTTSFAYAVAWTQHTNGPQVIGCCAMLQLLLGNIGRPGAGIMALRGHASIQGSTDIPTLYHSIHGYMSHPSALKKHETLVDYLATETRPRAYWANLPKFMVSYLKSMYGDAATPENDFGYDWHPKIIGDHSHMPMFVAMNEGRVKGMLLIGQNPATSLNAKLERAGMRKLQWLVVKDNWVHESANYWKTAPEIKAGEVKPQDIQTEVFFFPSTQIAEYEGSFTNTFRMLQWHYKAADPPGDCRSDLWFTHQLAKRLKKLYADSQEPRDQGFKNLTWDFDPDEQPLRAPTVGGQTEGGTVGGATAGRGAAPSAAGTTGEAPGAATGQAAGAAPPPGTPQHNPGEPDGLKILREINGYYSGNPGKHVAGFGDLKDDGSTTCASWIYSGVFPKPGENRSANRKPDPPDAPGGAQLGWAYSWPANRRVMYNRASADLEGKPWSERKKYIWWDGQKWTGYDVPDFAATKAPNAKGNPKGIGLDALSGTDPFIMLPDGVGWLYVPSGLVDGPLPAHYEPAESPVQNPLYKQQSSPVLKYWKRQGNELAQHGDGKYPYVITTYRLTEHYLAGAMSRWNPWLTELQPELFIEMSPELAQEKGIANLDWVRISTPRSQIRAKALVTRRMRPFNINGKTVHQVGMPWHWGYEGLSTGDVVNELTALVGDPNVSIHEGKAFVCNVEKA
jgi:formate dehydrogenase major subunit